MSETDLNTTVSRFRTFIPDQSETSGALARTTILCIAAHQDDTEFMAYHAIAACYENPEQWFTSVIVTDGAGSPRSGLFSTFTDDEMTVIRAIEQEQAAAIGRYSAQLQLGFSSQAVKTSEQGVVEALRTIIRQCKPEIIYTHNLADKHPSHVATTLRVLDAIRSLPQEERPTELIGLEVWRGLDWLPDRLKKVFDASAMPELARDLMTVFDSQIAGGKRYDEAVTGRRKANATFLGDHAVDQMEYAIYGIDMTALMDESASPEKFISDMIEQFRQDVVDNIRQFT